MYGMHRLTGRAPEEAVAANQGLADALKGRLREGKGQKLAFR